MTQDPYNLDVKLPQHELELVEESYKETIPKLDYGTCMKCEQLRSHYRWCQRCVRTQCYKNFANWTSDNEEIDKFLKFSQLNSISPQTFLEWIPYEKLERIKQVSITSYKATRSTVYSADWMDGPRIVWDQKIEEYKRSKIRVLVKLYDKDQVNEILNELRIYLDCCTQDSSLLIQFYGISKHPENNEYFIVRQYAQCGSLQDYILQNFYRLDWEIKLHLLFYLAEDLKALHNAGYVQWNFHPANILVLDNSLCAMGTFSNCRKASSSPDDVDVVFEWRSYLSPEYIQNKYHTKASNVYTFGMIMYTVGTGQIPFEPFKRFEDNQFLAINICQGVRPNISDDVPRCFGELIKDCWCPNPDSRPDISQVYSSLLQWWSSVYHNKCLTPISLEFLASDNRNYSKSEFQEIIRKPDIIRTKDIVFSVKDQLEPLELINLLVDNYFVKFIKKDELTSMEQLDDGHFGTISKTIWKKTNNVVACKRIKDIKSINNKPIEAFLHELSMHRRLDFCPRIIRILGISFGDLKVDNHPPTNTSDHFE
ncbi:11174_t:CDS:2, partial [Funneliformis caledonium]